MPKRRSKEIKIIRIDGKEYIAEYLGKGVFSKVYRVGNRAIYFTKGDCSKKVLAMYSFERLPHITEIVQHNNVGAFQVYSSPIYGDVKKSDTSAWRLMTEIIKLYKLYSSHLAVNFLRLSGRERMQGFVDMLEDDKSVPYSIIRSLQAMIEIYRNCGDNTYFDFHKQNFGVNEYGTLIFRDIAFIK